MDHAEQVALAEDHPAGFRSMTLDMEPRDTSRFAPTVQYGGALAEASPAGIMMAALARGVSPADLREMLALQREWRADEARNAFNKSMAGFKAEPVYVAKTKGVGYETKEGGFVGYKHAELADVVAAVGPALAKHGLSHRWDVTQTPTWITVRCILKHADGHSEFCEMGGPPDNSGKKNQIQQIASTVSYLQRYTLKAITGVAEGGDDNDGQGGADDAGATGTPTPPPPPPAPVYYAAAGFAKNLPAWSELILSGRKTADQIIAVAETKAPLTDQQKADLRAVAA